MKLVVIIAIALGVAFLVLPFDFASTAATTSTTTNASTTIVNKLLLLLLLLFPSQLLR
jgi:hypothetical protein